MYFRTVILFSSKGFKVEHQINIKIQRINPETVTNRIYLEVTPEDVSFTLSLVIQLAQTNHSV